MLQLSMGKVFRRSYDVTRELMRNPLKLIGARRLKMEGLEISEDEYDPDITRFDIGDIMMIALVVFVLAIVFVVIGV